MPTQVADLYGKISARIDDAQRNLRAIQHDLEGTGEHFDEAGDRSERSMQRAGDSTRSFGGDVRQLATWVGGTTVAITGFAMATKKAFDLGEEGAQIRQLEESFRMTGVSIEEMRASARGTVADTDLMAQSMNLLTGTTGQLKQELSTALPSLLEIAKASNKMNPTLGDTTFLLESIAEGVKRGSALRIDNAGIILSQATANERYAKTLGISADELTESQEKVALLHETLRQGETIIEQAGKSVESYTDTYSQLRTNIKNTTDDMKANISEGLTPFVEWLNKAVFGLRQLREEQERLNSDPLETDSYNDYIDAQKRLLQEGNQVQDFWMRFNLAAKKSNQVTDESVFMMRDLDKALGMVGDGLVDMTGIQSRYAFAAKQAGIETLTSAERFEQYSQASQGVQGIIDDTGEVVLSSAERFEQYNAAIQASAEAANQAAYEHAQLQDQIRRNERAAFVWDATQSTLGDTLFENSQEVGNLRQEQDQLLTQIRELEQQHGRAITVQNKSALSTHELALAQMDLAEAQERMAEAEPDSRAFHQAAQDVAELESKIGGAVGSTTALVDKSDDIASLREAYEEAGRGVDELITKSRELINQQMLEQLRQQFAADDTWSQLELDVFEGFAKSTGQWDQTWVQLIRPIQDANTEIQNFAGTAEDRVGAAERIVRELLGVSVDLRTEFGLIRDTAPQAFDSIDTENARGHIDSMVGVASDFNTELDKMSRDISIGIKWDVEELTVPSAISREAIGTPNPEMMADGGYLRPGATALAGEEGIEAVRALSGGGVQVVPLRGSGGNGGGGGGSRGGAPVNINIYGGDLAEVRRVVEGVLIDQGIVSHHGLRG